MSEGGEKQKGRDKEGEREKERERERERISRTIGVLIKLKHYLPSRILLTIYNTH